MRVFSKIYIHHNFQSRFLQQKIKPAYFIVVKKYKKESCLKIAFCSNGWTDTTIG